MKILILIKSFLLALLAPGLPQISSGRLKKGVTIFSISILLVTSYYLLGLWRYFPLLFLFLLFTVILVIYSAIEAFSKHEKRNNKLSLKNTLFLSFLLPILFWGTEIIAGKYSSVYEAFVPTNSMQPTIMDSEYVVIDENFYLDNNIHTGEVCLFYNDVTDNYFLKRVAGIPGDTVKFSEGRIFVNNSDYLASLPFKFNEKVEFPDSSFIVPDGYAFVLGDNLNNSFDSRYFGPVKIEYITGKPLYVYWSSNFDRIGKRI
ncbi:MAG: hypothetical protein SCALA702_21830 [Melioribacteraceae bacterium]|nr:MAG: hypothetical protein SCALA702_21830 [Melioribacteraceae bacterium]